MLDLRDISVNYGAIEALKGVSLTVGAGEIVCLIGANGAGKSTVLNAISGVVPLAGGATTFEGAPLSSLGSTQIVRKGIVQVPEGRLVFPDLTVLENLEMGGYTQPTSGFQQSLSAVFELFPRLAERRQQLAGLMSGGEQQMLAIGRALAAKPKLLLLDEPSMGLAPLVIVDIFQSLRRLRTDYIDLYWMHFWDRFTPIDETMRALDDLVRAGKVRYIGISDTPAWKVAQAQTQAHFRGWAPIIALQIEYSLIERTVEGELTPMALELGLGVTPWSPLRGGVLSGKYTRQNKDQLKSDRGERVTKFLTERTYTIIDELIRLAGELNSTAAAVALAWVQSRPCVVSTIIGARRLGQLDQNLAALDLALTEAQIAALNKVSEPILSFPAGFGPMATMFGQGGTTINGAPSQMWPMLPQRDDERY